MRQSDVMHSAAQHDSIHCSAPTHASSTSWIRLSAALPVANVPSWIAHTHKCTAYRCVFTHTHTITMIISWLRWPDYHCAPQKYTLFRSQQQKGPSTSWPFSPTQPIKYSFCCTSYLCKCTNYWQQIRSFQYSIKVAGAQKTLLIVPPMATCLLKMTFNELLVLALSLSPTIREFRHPYHELSFY